MPRNHHKCDDCIKQYTFKYPALKHRKCDSKRSKKVTGVLLNQTFNINLFKSMSCR